VKKKFDKNLYGKNHQKLWQRFLGRCNALENNLGIDPDGYNYFQFQNKYSQVFIGWKPNIAQFLSWRPAE
jgi:hypothetical protein